MHVRNASFPSAELKDLAAIRHAIREAGRSLGADEDAIEDLVIAVNEAVTNTIIHGYGQRPGLIEIELERAGRNLVLRLLDRARAFDPTTVASPDTTLPLEERLLGGMGVHMMREFTDQLRYVRRPDDRNELTFVKHGAVVSKDSSYS